MIEDPERGALSSSERAQILVPYRWESVAQRTAEVYQGVVSR